MTAPWRIPIRSSAKPFRTTAWIRLPCLSPQGSFSSQSIGQSNRLQRILYFDPQAYPLVSVPQPGPKV